MVGRARRPYASFSFGLTYVTLNSRSAALGKTSADDLIVGVSYSFDAVSVGAVYGRVLSATGDLYDIGGDDAYGLTGQYDLGGGASINGGVFRSYAQPALDDDGHAIIADFGIRMAF